MFNSKDVHCQYCMCPKDIWQRALKSYSGDECKLYDDFSNVICELEKAVRPFNNNDIINKCREDLEKDYTDIHDFEATIMEMIDIHYSEGYMPNNYRLLSVCK